MAVFVAGLIGIVFFYLAILVVGLWASRKAKDNSEEEMMLAGRRIGFAVGTLTLIATWVGGGYISGATEVMFSKGLAWAQVPIGYSIALLVGALLFVKPMRDMNCVTLLDPFQKRYGNAVGCLLFVPTIFGDIFWVASILNALGSALVVITGLSPLLSVIISACFVAAYTSVGAMYSVTYTDVFQMFFLLFGLLISIPFVSTSEYIDKERMGEVNWIGEIRPADGGEWFDTMMLLIFGGIPWQGYMQRILAIRSTKIAQYLSIFSTFGCAVMSIPSAYIGVAASLSWVQICDYETSLDQQGENKNIRQTEETRAYPPRQGTVLQKTVVWPDVPTFGRNITEEEASIVLPLVLRHLTPAVIAFFGLGAISAAVMSSADSSVLAFSAMVSRNIYKNLFRQRASDREVIWVLRITVLVITTLSAIIALTVSSVYYLSVLSSDLIYVILFPQLLLVVYWKSHVNSYGCIASFIAGGLLRILGGEQALGLPVVIKYPMYDYDREVQKFPHRTLAMLCTLLTHVVVSEVANVAFRKKILPAKMDFLKFFEQDGETDEAVSGSQLQMGEVKEVKPRSTVSERENQRKPRKGLDIRKPEKSENGGELSESLKCKNEEILNLKINDFAVNHRLKSFNTEKS